MPRLTVSLSEDETEIIEEKVGDDAAYESKSEFVRSCIHDHTRIENLETTIERLEREKQQILAQREEHTELVRYVQDERTLSQKRHQASAAQRIKWLLFGGDESE